MVKIREEIEERIIEMTWSCLHCGHQNPGLSGSEGESLRCGECGAPKGKGQEYQMPKDTAGAPTVTDEKLLKRAAAGPNKVCESCGKDVRGMHRSCTNCGAPFQKSVSPPQNTRTSAPVRLHTFVKEDLSRFERSTPWLPILGGVVGLGLLIWGAVWLFGSHTTMARVETNSWRYVESVKQRTLNHGENWDDEKHEGAFNVSCETRQHGTRDCNPRQCNPHPVSFQCNCTGGDSFKCNCVEKEECSSNGNGSARCRKFRECDVCTTPRTCQTCTRIEYETCYDQCPVMDEWCAYDYYTWPEVQHAEEQGTDQHVKWPGLVAVPIEQRLDKSETYAVSFTDGEHHWEFKPKSLGEYQKYPVDARYKVEYSHAGGFTPLERISK